MEWLLFFSERIIWGPALVGLFLGAGLFLSARLGFFQIVRFKTVVCQAFRGIFGKKEGKAGAVSPFQALATALAGTIGVGNIAGVAAAITAGGPGAIFWMWVSSLLGMATKYAEIVLSCRYRRKNERGERVGGPMYFLENGLHCKPLAVFFAFCALAAAVLGMGNMTQANTISGALFGVFSIPQRVTGLFLMGAVALVLFGGIARIARVTALLVPLLGLFYLLGACAVIGTHLAALPAAFGSIFRGAFGLPAFGGGVLGFGVAQALRVGLSRGVFTHEAGLGSSAMAHAASAERNPVVQGFLGVAEVFLDTMVMCTLTALAILCTGAESGGDDGVALTVRAFETALGPLGGAFVALATSLFAFASILGWSYYGELCAAYLCGPSSQTPYRVCFVFAVFLGSVLELSAVWAVADIANGLMAIPNLMGVLLLSGEVAALTRRHFQTPGRR